MKDGVGYDFRRNMTVAWNDYNFYSTDIFTQESIKTIQAHARHENKRNPLFLYIAHQVNVLLFKVLKDIDNTKISKQAVHSANSHAPLQAPPETINKFSYIKVRIMIVLIIDLYNL